MPGESSVSKGFGLGCGLVLGILAAIIGVPLLCCGGLTAVSILNAPPATKKADAPQAGAAGEARFEVKIENLPDGGGHACLVTFQGSSPPPAEVDKIVREALDKAV